MICFHPDKCHVLTLGKIENIQHAHRYCLNDQVLEHVDFEKDLGLKFDSDLSFDHICEKVKKANVLAGLIHRSFSYLSPEMFKYLFSAFVRPHLEYDQVVWSPRFRKHVNIIEGVQRRATKHVDGLKNLPYPLRLKRIGLPTLEYRRERADMVEMYKHIQVYDANAVPDRVKLHDCPSRKHNYQLRRNFPNDGIRGAQSKSFYFRAIKPWNEL